MLKELQKQDKVACMKKHEIHRHSYMLMELKGVLCHCLNYIYPNVPLN